MQQARRAWPSGRLRRGAQALLDLQQMARRFRLVRKKLRERELECGLARVKAPSASERMSKRKFPPEIIYAVPPLKVPCHRVALRDVLFLHLSGKDHLEESQC